MRFVLRIRIVLDQERDIKLQTLMRCLLSYLGNTAVTSVLLKKAEMIGTFGYHGSNLAMENCHGDVDASWLIWIQVLKAILLLELTPGREDLASANLQEERKDLQEPNFLVL